MSGTTPKAAPPVVHAHYLAGGNGHVRCGIRWMECDSSPHAVDVTCRACQDLAGADPDDLTTLLKSLDG